MNRTVRFFQKNSQFRQAAADIHLDAHELAQLDTLFDPQRVAGARYPDAGFVGMETR